MNNHNESTKGSADVSTPPFGMSYAEKASLDAAIAEARNIETPPRGEDETAPLVVPFWPTPKFPVA